ncbi:translation initiation factor IF-2 [Candidatus Saccharibacteria bacterium]|nr:translation initiation factor IF-2 [Candidatus Saccharibacteria bacterium]MBI3337746.1 translation initiation factor IF-2 [Candidatus Saccharibacteria bacterium]
MSSIIEIDNIITVGDLADKLMLPVTKLIAELMKNGVMATVNERIDFDTAQIIVGELDLDVELKKKDTESSTTPRQRIIASEKATPRPPVVAVMGHVDHGKTSLLDAIRGSELTKAEAGGITQHIAAYQVEHNGRFITLLDTPGHEAFAALREHGAQLTDLVIIVVAADDGVKPQTIEAIRFARKANVRIIVAINKMDKEGADSNQVKQQLAEQKLLVEEWGGDIVALEVSAKTKKGVNELLDMILLVADVEDLRADNNVPAKGLIIESHMERGRGPVAVALIEEGTLHSGDYVVTGATYAKIRNLESTNGKTIRDAGPSTPVVITGFKSLPEFGDEFIISVDEKTARQEAKTIDIGRKSEGRSDIGNSELIRMINRHNQVSEFNVIIKTDVQGSLTSVVDSLRTLDTEEVVVRVVASGVGPVNENDVHLARSSSAIIYGFNVPVPPNIKQLAVRDRIRIRMYKVIYELIDDTKDEMSKLLVPEIIETVMGQLVVKGVFKTTKTEVICGGEVTKGKLVMPALARVIRDKQELAEVEVTNLKRGTQDTKEVFEGEMCGMSLKYSSRVDLVIGDRVELFTRETKERKL